MWGNVGIPLHIHLALGLQIYAYTEAGKQLFMLRMLVLSLWAYF